MTLLETYRQILSAPPTVALFEKIFEYKTERTLPKTDFQLLYPTLTFYGSSMDLGHETVKIIRMLFSFSQCHSLHSISGVNRDNELNLHSSLPVCPAQIVLNIFAGTSHLFVTWLWVNTGH